MTPHLLEEKLERHHDVYPEQLGAHPNVLPASMRLHQKVLVNDDKFCLGIMGLTLLAETNLMLNFLHKPSSRASDLAFPALLTVAGATFVFAPVSCNLWQR